MLKYGDFFEHADGEKLEVAVGLCEEIELGAELERVVGSDYAE